MNKIMILAVAAIAMAACTKTYDKVETTEGQAIGFGTWNDVLTKARTTGNTATSFANGESFKVYGTKLVSATPYVVFNGDEVTATVSESVSWDYTTKRYWDPTATSYTFYAALPGSIVSALTDEEKTALGGDYPSHGKFKGSVEFDNPTDLSNDVMIANQKTVSNASFNTDVNMQFNHIASCVDLIVKKDNVLNSAVVKVTNLSLLNIKNEGDFAVSAYSTDVPTASWSNQSGVLETVEDSNEYTISLPVGGVTAGGSTTYTSHVGGAPVEDPGPATLFSGYVFLPQTLVAATQKIKFSYTIQVGEEQPNTYSNVTIDLASFMSLDYDNNAGGSPITSWAPGTHYTYYITIGANAITFTASVNEWANTSTGYHYLIN